MIEGTDRLDFSNAPGQRTRVSGLVQGDHLSLVRNPSWDPATDSLRLALPDRIEFTVFTELETAAQAVYDGEAHMLLNQGAPFMPAVISDAVQADPGLAKININRSDTTGSIVLNVAQPPFDDLELRRAAAFMLDKAALVEVVGPYIVRPGHHLVPDALEDNLLVDYRPYPSVGDEGDIRVAKEHMRQSRYDTDGDGLCDAPECEGVVAYTRDQGFFAQIAESVRSNLESIGVELDVHVVDSDAYFNAYLDPSSHVAMFAPLGWTKDSLSPASFFVGQFYSPIALADVGNASLVGASAEQLAGWGYETTTVPNVDDRIEACLPLTGSAAHECWAALDQHMMENVVSNLTFGDGTYSMLTSHSVEPFVWDQLTAAPAYDQIVVAR
jgi:peptide/nickel transport system substrate-binding protein